MNELQCYEVVYEHNHPPSLNSMWGSSICDECGAVPYPTPSGKIGVLWLMPTNEKLYRIDRDKEAELDYDTGGSGPIGMTITDGVLVQVWPVNTDES